MFIGDNRLAAGALHALGKVNAGRSVPIAIAAFYDGAALSTYAPPMIAAIQPAYEIGRTGARRLFDRLAGKPVESRHILLADQIMVLGDRNVSNQTAPGS